MTGTGTRTMWSRLAFALAVIAVIVVQGIGGAIARSSQSSGSAHTAWCGSESGQVPDGSSSFAHEQCCLPGGRHDSGGDAPALAAASFALLAPGIVMSESRFGAPQPPVIAAAGYRPPVRGPPVR